MGGEVERELGGIQGRETLIRLYCRRKEVIFNKKIEEYFVTNKTFQKINNRTFQS